jgi:hypothetical protein
MGLDGTIRRADGEPLGDVAAVQHVLSAAFPGIVFGRLPSGEEEIRAAAARGVVFPDVIRESFERTPAQHGGEFKGADYSASFNLGASDTVQSIDVVLYGTTTASESMFTLLEERFGWITTHP